MIQGEDRKGAPQRGTGHRAVQRSKNYNFKEKNVIIAMPYIGQMKQGAKNTQRTPTSRGNAHRTVQHDNGHSNSPTTPPDHLSRIVIFQVGQGHNHYVEVLQYSAAWAHIAIMNDFVAHPNLRKMVLFVVEHHIYNYEEAIME